MIIINWIENNMLTTSYKTVKVSRGYMDMEIISQQSCIVVRCGAKTDRLDAVTSNTLRKNVFKSISKTARPDRPVILDLQGVNYIDDSGLGAILSVMQAMQEKTEMLLCGAGENLKNIFRLTRVDGVLKSYDSLDEAKQEAEHRVQQKKVSIAVAQKNGGIWSRIYSSFIH